MKVGKKASEDEEEEKMVGAETFAKRRRKTHTHNNIQRKNELNKNAFRLHHRINCLLI